MKNTKINKIELLAPAGTYECFLAAIHNGADAVYFAGEKFGARAYAGNFSEEEVINAINYAHLFNKRVYLTVNTVIKESEFNELYDYIYPFYIVGLDGVIVQDIGAIKFLGINFPDMELHASTQMSITDIKGVEFLKKFGVVRVVTARELSLYEIKNIIDATGIEIETFIHGAMCYCYSGKCLFSSMIGGRSGNRGRCAQPCRLTYNNTHAISMKDMMGIEIIPALVEAGIASLKIEGRMKSPAYVSTVTSIYRKYIDLYYKNPSGYKVSENDLRILLDGYTRSGNCEGYYYKYNGKDMITFDFAGYNGEKKENNKQITSLNTPKLHIKCEANFNSGKEACLRLIYDEIVSTTYGDKVEKAEKKPLDRDNIKRQLGKTGDSPFTIDEMDVNCSEDIFMPISRINELRRNAIEDLTNRILSNYKRKASDGKTKDAFLISTAKKKNTVGKSVCKLPQIAAEVCSFNQLKVIVENDYVNTIVIPSYLFGFSKNNKKSNYMKELSETDALLIDQKGLEKDFYLRMPYVLRNTAEDYKSQINRILNRYNIKGILVCNYEELALINEINYSGEIIADIHLYSLNSEAYAALIENGVTNTVVPIELNKKELIKRGITGEILNVYGRIPLMVSAQCVRKNLSRCTHEAEFFFINDRKNVSIPFFCNCHECLNIQYNNVPLYIEKDNDVIGSINPQMLKFNFTNESEEEINKIINKYVSGVELPFSSYTKAHLNRGVE